MSRLSKLGFIDTERTRLPVRRRIRSRGVPTALVGHEVACTHDVAEATDLVSQLFGRAQLKVLSTDEPFQTTLNAIRLRDVSMAYLDFHAATELEVASTGDHYTVHMPMNGITECEYDEERINATAYHAVVVNPGTRLRMCFELDSPHLLIRVERQALETQLSRLLARSCDRPVRFDPMMDLTSEPAVRWHGAIQLLSSEVMTKNSLIQKGIGGGPMEELLITSLLWVHTSNWHDELSVSHEPSGRPAVRRSIAYIEENLALPITLGDLAAHTRMSVRSIQQGFREDLGTTPMAYLRDRRLERVRAELADSVPREKSVTQVAERWGFTHLGTFSAVYRRRFGETPSATLRR